jgi:hypothetical protein
MNEVIIKKNKELDEKVDLWAFRYSLPNVLKKELAQEYIYYLDEFLSEILIRQKR